MIENQQKKINFNKKYCFNWVIFIWVFLLVFVVSNSQAKTPREYIGLKCGSTNVVMFYPGFFEGTYAISSGIIYQTVAKHQFGISYTYVRTNPLIKEYFIQGSFDYFLNGKRNRLYMHSEVGYFREPFIINQPPTVLNYSYKVKESAANFGLGIKYLVLLGSKWYLNLEGVAGLNYMFSNESHSYAYEMLTAAYGTKYKDQIIQFSTRFELGIQKMF